MEARTRERKQVAMQVLIVEDDVRLAQALAHILAENGYQTDVVHDGASGLAYAECGDYDVIILDVMLPKMDGFAVVAQLRALTRRQGEVLFEKLAAGDLALNLESYDLSCGSKSIHLSYKEFSLAKVLMANAGQVVSKDMLIAKVWGVESSAEDNNVEAYVSFLRKKMKFLGSAARIETLRRAGYRFVADAAPDDASESAGRPC